MSDQTTQNEEFKTAYDLLLPTAAKLNTSVPAVEWAKRLLDGKTKTSDMDEDFFLVAYAADIYALYDAIAQKIIMSVANAQFKTALWEALKEARQTKAALALDEQTVEAIKSSLSTIDWQISSDAYYVSQEMGKVQLAATNLEMAVEEAEHKPFYDYISTLKTPSGTEAVSDEMFLANEIAKLIRLEAEVYRKLNSTLADMPYVKEEIKTALLIPPGLVKGLAMGAKGRQIFRLLQCTQRAATFFLNKLRGIDPSNPGNQ